MREAEYQRKLIPRIKARLPGCLVLKNDPALNPGIPDLLILFRARWGMLETKRTTNASRRPNQEYYVNKYDRMSFAAFICPENESEVLDELQHALGA